MKIRPRLGFSPRDSAEIQNLLVTFSLERKSNQKVQGKPDRSARFSGLARGKSQWIDHYCVAVNETPLVFS
jgi:hypothetical protein